MSSRIYAVTKTDIDTENYDVKLNGVNLELNTARVSAYPFNRAWPGHQRQIEQTELVNFVSFACEGENILEIKSKESFENVIIRPQSLKFKHEVTSDGTVKVYMTKPAYFTIEPFGRKNALHIFADPMIEYRTCENEEVIYFGEGEHEVGVIELKDNQTLFLDEGAVVYARIHALDAKNIKIVGHGILDNSHNKAELLFEANVENNGLHSASNAIRRHTIHLEYCENIEIKGITIRDSLLFTIVPAGCRNVEIKNVKIIGNWRYNSDGIDVINSENIHIADCFIRTFDDSICAKGFSAKSVQNKEEQLHELICHNGGDYSVFKDVLVENCVIWNDWGKCLEIGAETCANEICNFNYRNCDLIHVTGTVISCLNVDWADIHDINYENINIEYDDQILIPKIQSSNIDKYESHDLDFAPETIGLEIAYSSAYSSIKDANRQRGKIRNFSYKNICLYGRQQPFLFFKGFDSEHQCENITIQNFYHNGKKLDDLSNFKLEVNEFQKNIVIK
ncbi:MAG: hypothetical protein IKD09_02520 [Lentisphaeria bacterium]|nr:hypothetical protein [Lentisphaeria bacterium]